MWGDNANLPNFYHERWGEYELRRKRISMYGKFNLDERGMATIEFIIGAVLMTFVMFFPIAVLVEFNSINTVQQQLDRALEMAAVEGGLNSSIETKIKQALSDQGVDNATFTADSTRGAVEKGSVIKIGITAPRPGKNLYGAVKGLIGGDNLANDHLLLEGTIISEYIP